MPLSGSIAIGAVALAITAPSLTSGRITQLRAGGVNGFATSQPAGSRSTIGAPLDEPPRLLVERQLRRGLVADVAAQDRLAVGVGEVEHGAIEPERLAHLVERRAGQHGQLARRRRARATRVRRPRARPAPRAARRSARPVFDHDLDPTRYSTRARDHRRRPPVDARGHGGAAGRGPADRGRRAGVRRARSGRARGAAASPMSRCSTSACRTSAGSRRARRSGRACRR